MFFSGADAPPMPTILSMNTLDVDVKAVASVKDFSIQPSGLKSNRPASMISPESPKHVVENPQWPDKGKADHGGLNPLHSINTSLTKNNTMPDLSSPTGEKVHKSHRWAITPKSATKNISELFHHYYDDWHHTHGHHKDHISPPPLPAKKEHGSPKMARSLTSLRTPSVKKPSPSTSTSHIFNSFFSKPVSSTASTVGNASPPPLDRQKTTGSTNSLKKTATVKNAAIPRASNVPSTRSLKDACLSPQFTAALSASIPEHVHIRQFNLLKFLNGIYIHTCFHRVANPRVLDTFEIEKKFSEQLSRVIREYVTPLMDGRGLIIKELHIKQMFEELTKIHTFSLGFQETVKMDLRMYKTEEALETGVHGMIENLVRCCRLLTRAR